MGSDQDDLVGLPLAPDLCDDVGPLTVLLEARSHHEPDADFVAALDEPPDEERVLDRQGSGRDLGGVVLVLERARVRGPERCGRDRPDERRGRAELGRGGRSLPPVLHRLARFIPSHSARTDDRRGRSSLDVRPAEGVQILERSDDDGSGDAFEACRPSSRLERRAASALRPS
jgi:hypothetical protein